MAGRSAGGVSTGGYGLSRSRATFGESAIRGWHGGGWEGRQILPAEWLDKARHATVPMGLGSLRYGNLFWSLPEREHLHGGGL